MLSEKFFQETKKFLYFYVNPLDLQPTQTYITAYRRSGNQFSGKSPRVNGVLKLRPNAYDCATRWLFSNHVVPRYHPAPHSAKISGYYQCEDASTAMTTDTYLRDFVKNKVASKVADVVREFGINVSVHIGEFFLELSYFQKRFNDVAAIISALLSRKGRLALFKKATTKAQKEYDFVFKTYRKYGTMPRSLHDHPDYYPKRNRHRILRDLREDISRREKSAAKEASELTLEWSYAVSPILTDMQKLASKIDNYDLIGTEMKVTKGGNSSHTRTNGSGQSYYVVTSETKVISRLVGTMAIRDLMKNTLQQFGLNSMELTLWELTPFSFVVDWFFPISDWLTQFKAFDGWDCSDISTTTTTETFCRVQMQNGAYSVGSHRHVKRVLGPPAYKLMLVNPFTSVRRGINQLALAGSLGLKR